MADVFSKAQRSSLMSRVRSGDTVPEKVVRCFLHSRGLRFRLHDAKLPGKPDIVLRRFRTVVFVNGCFWHGHRGCAKGRHRPTSNVQFWEGKIEGNMKRDRTACRQLRHLGWKVLVVWECQVKRPGRLERLFECLLREDRLP